jgi:hypothetical protein
VRKRTRHSLQRRAPNRQPKECVLIVCDAEATEPKYFRGLREKLGLRRFVDVKIVEKPATSPQDVVSYAIQRKKERYEQSVISNFMSEYDDVWCVLDVEVPRRPGLQEAIRDADNEGVTVILSNPCFEFWYLLHFKKVGSRFQSAADVIRELKKHVERYSKSDSSVIDKVFEHTDDAIKNAKKLIRERKYGEDLTTCNPSTHVHLVVSRLKKAYEDQPVKKRT